MPPIDRQATFSGTKDVADALAFDAAPLEAYLAARLPDFAGPLDVRQFKGGQSNPTYLLETPARRYVLRRKPPGKLLPSAHAVDREFRVISALHAQGFPVAAPVLACADDGIVGTPFYVMAHVEGRVVWEPHMPDAPPAERAAVYDAMNATLARLHAFDPAALGLADFGRGENYVARQVERWSKQYRASETEQIDEMEHLIAWLPAHLPPSAPVRLVHGDYRLDNIILAPAAPTVLAVLDWELSTLGDPLADLAYHLMQWDMPASARCWVMISPRSASRRADLTSTPMWRAPASIRARSCRSTSLTISSGWRRSCRASSAACATAPPPARTPPPWRRWCVRSP
jgi:aminoglycoside phosphotransferase (APT) family kinase protein